jgi:dTDP-4-amino-4,6-dideoxygalactose transaminase
MEKRIWLSAPAMCGKEIEFINQAFKENWIAPLGPNVNAFEDEMCKYTGAKNAVAMTTGTSAIHMALKYLGVGDDDIVFCSSLTFAASCNPIMYQNSMPVFIDSEPESWNMSPVALQKAFNKYPKPKAVIAVNLYGQSTDMEKILEICNKYNVPIIEDAAESLGAAYKNKKSGTFGRFGVFSFNGNKIITTSGGGMLICPDEISKKKILKWITQSRDEARHYEHSELGYNYRMSNICAGIGRGQLTALDERVKQKKAIYYRYKEAFSEIKAIEMMPICDYGEPNYWLSCFTIKKGCKVNPTDIIIELEKENIESRPIWKPMHLQPFYKKYDYFTHDSDVSADIFNRGICLPSDVNMTNDDVQKITNIVRGCFNV